MCHKPLRSQTKCTVVGVLHCNRTKSPHSTLQPTVMQMPPLLHAQRTMCTGYHGCYPTLDSKGCACEVRLHAKLNSMTSSVHKHQVLPHVATPSLDRPANTGTFCSFSSQAVWSTKFGTRIEIRPCDAVHAASGAFSMQLALAEDDLVHLCGSGNAATKVSQPYHVGKLHAC